MLLDDVKDLLDIEHDEYDKQIEVVIKSFNEKFGELIPQPEITDTWYNSYLLVIQWEVAKNIDIISETSTLEFIEKMSISTFNELRSIKPWERQ